MKQRRYFKVKAIQFSGAAVRNSGQSWYSNTKSNSLASSLCSCYRPLFFSMQCNKLYQVAICNPCISICQWVRKLSSHHNMFHKFSTALLARCNALISILCFLHSCIIQAKLSCALICQICIYFVIHHLYAYTQEELSLCNMIYQFHPTYKGT